MTDESIWSKAQPRGISRSLPRRKTGLASNTKKSYIKSKSHCLIFYQSIVGGLYTIISEGKFTQSKNNGMVYIFLKKVYNKSIKSDNVKRIRTLKGAEEYGKIDGWSEKDLIGRNRNSSCDSGEVKGRAG